MQYFIIGAPGTGKTVVAAHLASKLKIKHLNYRSLVIDFAEGRSKAAKKIQKLRESSEPFPARDAFKILKDRLEETGTDNFVLDGYPKDGVWMVCVVPEEGSWECISNIVYAVTSSDCVSGIQVVQITFREQ